MFGIGVTNRTDDELMRKISDVYFKVEQFQELEDKLQEINEAVRKYLKLIHMYTFKQNSYRQQKCMKHCY